MTLPLWHNVKRLLKKVKKESENVDLKLNIQKTKIMASSLITSWEIDGEAVETVTDLVFCLFFVFFFFFFLAPKSLKMVTAAMKLKDTCSLKEKL